MSAAITKIVDGITNMFKAGDEPELPPENANDQAKADRELLDKINNRMEEAREYRGGLGNQSADGTTGLTLEDQWEISARRFMGDHWSLPSQGGSTLIENGRVQTISDVARKSPGARRSVLNRTQGAVIATVAAQTLEAPTITFDAIESGDPNVYFLSASGGIMLGQMVTAAQMQVADAVTTGVTGQADPMTGALASVQFDPAAFTGDAPINEQQAALVKGFIGNGLMLESDLMTVNDKEVADAANTAFGALTDRSGFEQAMVLNVFYTSIFGSQPLMFGLDFENGEFKFSFDNVHILNVWVDHAADCIEKAATMGSGADDQFRMGAPFRANYRRRMVKVRKAWLRNQPMPMTTEEAMSSGKVVQEQVPPMPFAVLDDAGRPLEAPPEQPSEPRLMLADTGEPTDPTAPNWPTKRGLLQVVCLPDSETIIEQIPCPFKDIPCGWNRNIPGIYNMYGQGEPVRMDAIQQSINRLLTIMDNHSLFYQYPMRYWPKSVLDKIKAAGVTVNSRPGAEIPIPDSDYWRMVRSGRVSLSEDVPALPPEYVQLFAILLAEHDRISGNSDVKQGFMPKGAVSGRAIDSLRSEAAGPLSFRARFGEFMLERLGRIALQAMIDFMPTEQWAEILNKYPPGMLQEIIRRLECRKWNVKASIKAGRGLNTAQAENRAARLYAGGGQGQLISRRTAQTMSHVADPESEDRRIMDERREMMAGRTPQSPAGQQTDGSFPTQQADEIEAA